MRINVKLLLLLLASGLVALAAWFVDGPRPAQADEVPEKYRPTVLKGLECLVKNQSKDGHWEGDNGKHPVAMTGLAGLALLMDFVNDRATRLRSRTPKRKYAANIDRAADWLMSQSQAGRDGLIFSEHASETSRYMEGHGLATLFLAGAYDGEMDEARQKKFREVLTRAVKYIAKAQSSNGGWYHTSKVEGHDFADISATVIQFQALQAAQNAGITVPDGVINHAKAYLEKTIGKHAEKAMPKKNERRPIEIAMTLACLNRDLDYTRAQIDLHKEWYRYCQAGIPVGDKIQLGSDELTHYYFAQAVFFHGGWREYRSAVFDHLQSNQNKDGSWAAGNGLGVGPIYSTAVWCIVMQLDHRSHPSMQRERVEITTRGPEVGPGLRFPSLAQRPRGDLARSWS